MIQLNIMNGSNLTDKNEVFNKKFLLYMKNE